MNELSSRRVGAMPSKFLKDRKLSKPTKQVVASPLKKGSNRKQRA